MILDMGADLNLAVDGFRSPIYFAVLRDDVEALKTIIKRGATWHKTMGPCIPLSIAVKKQREDHVRSLIELRVEANDLTVHVMYHFPIYPLTYSIVLRHDDAIFNTLLEVADIQPKQGPYFTNALHFIVGEMHRNYVKAIINQ
jgi:hypothetical protein